MPSFSLSHYHFLSHKERLGLQLGCVLLETAEFEGGPVMTRAWKQEEKVIKINTKLVYICTGNFPRHIKMETKRSN